MAEDLLEVIETGAPAATASVIWMHGLGASGHDFEPIVPQLGLPDQAPVRFVFPHAPAQPVTLNAGVSMPAWYDVYGLTAGTPQDAPGLDRAAGWIGALIAREIERGVAADRIVLAGFSQGGAVALHTGLRYPSRLAGVMGLSTYLPVKDRVAEAGAPANRETPIFLAHGQYDGVLGFDLGIASRDALQTLGYTVEWHEYPMEHQVCLEEVQAIGAWLTRVLAL